MQSHPFADICLPTAPSHYEIEPVAKYCASFIAANALGITDLRRSPSSGELVEYITWTLRRTKLRAWRVTAFGALVLLGRLKEKSQIKVGGSVWRCGCRLWLLTFMLASKSLVDNTFGQRAWAELGRTILTRQTLDKLERGLCRTLDWELVITDAELGKFGGGLVPHGTA
ncbi:hypothetical protein BKA62DRAFT_663290 [Auriculariales sp. MPI-PUGE-AT-0066]|nr:hypothetical protein BKA62DRAFT_663290 [Auriculariales sp. MPI-PUGE-AT-0066]